MQNKHLKYDLVKSSEFQFYSKFVFTNNLYVMNTLRPLDEGLQDLLDDNLPFLSLDIDLYYNTIELKSLKQLFDARRQKILRLKKRIIKMCSFSQNVWFLTLTWSPKVLESTSAETRRTYVNRFLTDCAFIDYYANIDFGDVDKNPKTKFREHYHCVIALRGGEVLPKWKYGWFNYKLVTKTSKSITKLSSYCNKLCYHALKDSTKNQKAICPKQTHYNFISNGQVQLPNYTGTLTELPFPLL